MMITNLYAIDPGMGGDVLKKMSKHDNTLRRTLFSTRRVQKRFEKTRSRMVYHAILGLGDFPQQASRWQLLAKGTLLALFCLTFLWI